MNFLNFRRFYIQPKFKISPQQIPILFYSGTLLSSIGSMTLTISLIAFMLKSGFSLLQISVIIASSRIMPVIVSVLFGHRIDKYSPRKIILITETLASLSSLLLLAGWNTFNKSFIIILTAMLLRTFFISLQTGSRSLISKSLSDSSFQSNSKNAIWLNKVTQGATLFAGLIAWVAIKHGDFQTIIVFDGITFILNGAILFVLPLKNKTVTTTESISILKKFSDLYKFNRWAATLDAILVLSMAGTSAFTARLAGTDEIWIALFVMSYGLAVWLAGFAERVSSVRSQRILPWVILGTTLIMLGQFTAPSLIMWLVCLFKDLAFWILFHRITAHIQNDTPKEIIVSVTFARNAQVISIFSIGEIAVGLWKNSLTIQSECLLRAAICAVALILILFFGNKGFHEKSHL